MPTELEIGHEPGCHCAECGQAWLRANAGIADYDDACASLFAERSKNVILRAALVQISNMGDGDKDETCWITRDALRNADAINSTHLSQ